MFKPAYGSGIVSSFFTFYDGKDFPTNWSEIDFEVLGRNTNQIDTNVIRTVKGYTDKNALSKRQVLSKRASDVFWKLCIEWTPEYIVWRVNDIVIRDLAIKLRSPQKIMMNIWKSDSVGWAGEFNAGMLPQEAEYKYVRYSSLDGQFWQDNFNFLDNDRWQIADWPIEGTQMVKENVSLRDGNLVLKLTA
jgi:endo-1,3-1,4-beta-glycanase ExoK